MQTNENITGLNRLAGRLRLAKIWLCLLIGLSTLFGYLMARGELRLAGLATSLGIFFLAMGEATFNSYQERELDACMARTRNRPLVRKEFNARQAIAQAILLVLTGTLLIWSSTASLLATLLGLSGIVLYNLVYTPMKRRSLLAILPGAVCGALPPCVGWVSGGGEVTAYNFWLLFALFFLWQIPHFWLVMLMHKQDYQNGLFPSLLDRFPDGVIRGFFIPWVGSLLAVMLLYSFLPGHGFIVGRWWLMANCLLLAMFFLFQLGKKRKPAYRFLFVALNVSLLLHMGVVSAAMLAIPF